MLSLKLNVGVFALNAITLVAQLHGQTESSVDVLLDDLGRSAIAWFQQHHHPVTQLVLDRAPNDAGFTADPNSPAMASVASCGYWLSILPEAARLGIVPKSQAAAEAQRLMQFSLENIEHRHGLLYHFVDWRTGKRWRDCEVSTLDTAIFLNGCMVASVAFGGDVAELADALLDRADWQEFLITNRRDGRQLLSLGWHPDRGLLSAADVRSSEMAMPYFLAVGSRKHAIPAADWYNTAIVYGDVAGMKVLNHQHPLFTSYYGLGWHDLEHVVDRDGVDLFANARTAALANRAFCRQESQYFKTYEDSVGGWWGISAGDAPRGYVAPGPIHGQAEGIVWPIAALAAFPWVPHELERDLKEWRNSEVWTQVSGPYGLVPFGLLADKPWFAPDLIGIDVGSFAVSWANYRHRTVWDLWMQHDVATKAMERLELKPHASRSRQQQ